MDPTEPEADELILVAITRRRLVEVTYNKGRSLLAPHSIVERNGQAFLRAVTIARDRRPPREAKLGTFKLSGLSEVVLTRRLFTPALFTPLDPAWDVGARRRDKANEPSAQPC
jgi:hypothetical protein